MLSITISAFFMLFTVTDAGKSENGSKHVVDTPFERLCAMDLDIVETLRLINLSRLSREETEIVWSYVEDFENSHFHLQGLQDAGTSRDKVRIILHNPISKFRMVYRMEKKFPRIQAMGITEKYDYIISDNTVADLAIGILYFCVTYDLDPFAVANGILLEEFTGTSLRAEHCFEIGVNAVNISVCALGIIFLEAALEKTVRDATICISKVQDMLESAIAKHDLYVDHRDLPMNNRALLFHQKIGPLRKKFPDTYKSKRVLAKELMLPSDFDEQLLYWDLCKRSLTQSIYNTKEKSSCRLDSTAGPYWTLCPLKVEQYSELPIVLQVYDVLTEKQLASLASFATADMVVNPRIIFRSTERFGHDVNRRTSVERLASQQFYSGPDNPVEQLLHPTASSLLRLLYNFDSLLDYGYIFNVCHAGDFLGPHIDQVAVLMYNMEVAEIGGSTVFMSSRVAVRAVRGSVVLWYTPKDCANQHSVDYHGGCSILFGRKFNQACWFDYAEKHVCQRKNVTNPDNKHVYV